MADGPKTMADRIAELRERRAKLEAGGGPARHEKQHESGKLTARERLDILLDPGTMEEIGLFAEHRTTMFGMDKAVMPADGVVTGIGQRPRPPDPLREPGLLGRRRVGRRDAQRPR